VENKEQIAQAAEDLFMAYGVRSVTMDDISRKISISKKTIYQYYRDKDEVVCLVTKRVLQKEKEKMLAIKEVAQDAIHEIFLLSQYLRKHTQNVNPSILFDLQKYHQNAWKIYLSFKENVFIDELKATLYRGISEGYFREDIDVDILAQLRIMEIQMAGDQDIFPQDKFDFKNVIIQLFDHFMQGVLTENGRKKLAQYSEKVENNEV
jgi:AcrR family transcriptional regulator